mgnify:CR=1 FL=1
MHTLMSGGVKIEENIINSCINYYFSINLK